MVRLPNYFVIRILPETVFQKSHLLLVKTQGGNIHRRMIDKGRRHVRSHNKGNRAASEKKRFKRGIHPPDITSSKRRLKSQSPDRLMMLQNDLSIQRSTGPDRQTIASVWFDNTVPILLFRQKVSSANSDMRRGSSTCRSKFIIRNSHATAQNLKERLSGFFQFFTAQPVNIPVLLHFNLGTLLICYGGPIRILTVFDFAKFRQYTQQGISISIPFRAAGTIQHHQCTRPYLGTLRIGFRIDDSRHWRVITSSPSMRK